MSIKKKKTQKLELSILSNLSIVFLIIIVLGSILHFLEFQGDKAAIVNSSLNEGQRVVETTIATVNNTLSIESFEKVLSFLSTDFIASMLTKIIFVGAALGVMEKSGLAQLVFKKFNKLKARYLIFMTVIVSFIFNFLGPQGMLLLIPLFALIYKYAIKNPQLGIYTSFISFNVGYGFSIFNKNIDYTIGNFTQLAANVERNINYVYSPTSVIFLNLVGTIFLSVLLSYLIYKMVYPKTTKIIIEEEVENSFKWKTTLFLSVMILLVMVYGLTGSGFLLDLTQDNYILRIVSETSIFTKYFIYLFSFFIMIVSFTFGKINKTIDNSFEASRAISFGLKGYERIFPIMIVSYVVFMLLMWTNIAEVFMVNVVDIFGVLQFSGMPLVITFILIALVGGFLLPFDYLKWSYLSPIIVPLFMRTNMTPDYAQIVFVIFTGIGSTLSIFSIYLFFTLGQLKKNMEDEIRLSEAYSIILKPLIIITLFMILFVLSWYLIGLPIGPKTFTTM